jgi:multicomponent Na+:H+ antiporter subunit B
MTQGVLALWILSGVWLIFENRIYRLIIYFGIFSLITSLAYLLMGAPDIAMAEAAISAFCTIFFIICIEKYYGSRETVETERTRGEPLLRRLAAALPPLLFCAGLFALFVYAIPDSEVSTYLKYQYMQRFMADVGGENAVTAIYLGYRVYDTLFEALILVIAVVAVSHMSYFREDHVDDGRHSEMEASGMAVLTMRVICPIIIVFGAYLILNGHISAGGGFQGGLAVASFFICRYMVYGIYDIPIKKVIKLEEIVFLSITVVTVFAVFLVASAYVPAALLPFYQDTYLIVMNLLIGLKVACGFFALFYRYIAIERR